MLLLGVRWLESLGCCSLPTCVILAPPSLNAAFWGWFDLGSIVLTQVMLLWCSVPPCPLLTQSCSTRSHWAPGCIVCLVLWLGNSPLGSHEVRADLKECPPASTQYLHHVRIKSRLEMLNHRCSSLTLTVVFLWLPLSLTTRFVITDSMHFPLPFSLNPERTKPGHSCLVTIFPFPVSFPSLSSYCFSGTTWVGFLIDSFSCLFSFWL